MKARAVLGRLPPVYIAGYYDGEAHIAMDCRIRLPHSPIVSRYTLSHCRKATQVYLKIIGHRIIPKAAQLRPHTLHNPTARDGEPKTSPQQHASEGSLATTMCTRRKVIIHHRCGHRILKILVSEPCGDDDCRKVREEEVASNQYPCVIHVCPHYGRF